MNSRVRIEAKEKGTILNVVAFPQNSYGYVPSIRVAGKWLRSFGFDIGDRVILRASHGKIVITKERG